MMSRDDDDVWFDSSDIPAIVGVRSDDDTAADQQPRRVIDDVSKSFSRACRFGVLDRTIAAASRSSSSDDIEALKHMRWWCAAYAVAGFVLSSLCVFALPLMMVCDGGGEEGGVGCIAAAPFLVATLATGFVGFAMTTTVVSPRMVVVTATEMRSCNGEAGGDSHHHRRRANQRFRTHRRDSGGGGEDVMFTIAGCVDHILDDGTIVVVRTRSEGARYREGGVSPDEGRGIDSLDGHV